METERIKRLLDYCRRELGEDLRVFTRYGRDVHETIYTRADLQAEFDEDSRGVYRYVLMDVHDAIWRMKRVHTSLEDPDVATYSYGAASFVQFPVTEDEGILVTVDAADDIPADFVSECAEIVYGDERARTVRE